MPLLAICRGIQELNVALGGSAGDRDPGDRGPPWTTARRPPRTRTNVLRSTRRCASKRAAAWPDLRRRRDRGQFACTGRAIGEVAPRLTVEAVAGDGTVEAVSVVDAPGFAIGVQVASGILGRQR